MSVVKFRPKSTDYNTKSDHKLNDKITSLYYSITDIGSVATVCRAITKSDKVENITLMIYDGQDDVYQVLIADGPQGRSEKYIINLSNKQKKIEDHRYLLKDRIDELLYRAEI